jgi:hypothetical protein
MIESTELFSWMFTIFGVGILVSAGLTYLWIWLDERKKRLREIKANSDTNTPK